MYLYTIFNCKNSTNCFLFKNQAIERELIEKIDKADLLQMTVDYLKNFQNGKYVKHNIFS